MVGSRNSSVILPEALKFACRRPQRAINCFKPAYLKCVEDKYSRCHKNAYELSPEILNERVMNHECAFARIGGYAVMLVQN